MPVRLEKNNENLGYSGPLRRGGRSTTKRLLDSNKTKQKVEYLCKQSSITASNTIAVAITITITIAILLQDVLQED